MAGWRIHRTKDKRANTPNRTKRASNTYAMRSKPSMCLSAVLGWRSHLGASGVPVGGGLVHPGDAEQLLLLEGLPEQLETDRQTGLRESARNADARNAREIARHRVHI